MLDLMALHKLNVFHWHLTEDQGWRIEIKKYPRLTEIGSQRAGTARSLFSMFTNTHDGIPHGGYYTQNEIKEIVKYAAERHIIVVPEIEMPGHSSAALAAYPEFSCSGGPFEVPARFGIFRDIFCPGKESTFTFLQSVLDEVLDLFPSPYIHIGGDEAPKSRWKKCPDCQNRIQREGLAGEHGLQVYLTNRIAKYLESKGRSLVTWNVSLYPGLAENVVLQYWVGSRREVKAAIRAGREVVVSSYPTLYLDQSHKLVSLSRAYKHEPVFHGLREGDSEHVLGLEATMWTEFVPDQARLDYQTFPRLAAFAETGWSPKELKYYPDFQKRLSVYLPRLKTLGVKYAPEEEFEPSRIKQLFGVLTILQSKNDTAT
jgi:hexosaminidase